MTHVELRDLLINRIGWKDPIDSVISVSSENLTTESGRYYQDEYPSITISNIKDCIRKDNVSENDVNKFLRDLASQNILLVIADVFRVSDIYDNILTNCENIFDNAISKRMAISVGELIINNTNSSREERLNKEIQQKVFFELNGNADSSSDRANPHFPTYVGLKSRYGAEILELRSLVGQEDALDTFTYRVPDYFRDETGLSWYDLGGFL